MSVDTKILNKIEGLLRQAESTNHPAEAESFTAKAEELMARWSIDRAHLRAARTAGDAAADIDTIEILVWKSAMQSGRWPMPTGSQSACTRPASR